MYTFHDGEDLYLSPATGMNEMYQHSDADGIIIGGSIDKNYAPALTLMNNFSTGHSGRSETYDN